MEVRILSVFAVCGKQKGPKSIEIPRQMRNMGRSNIILMLRSLIPTLELKSKL